MIDSKRRKVLKGFLYGSVLTASSISSLALAATKNKHDLTSITTPSNDISIIRKTVSGKEQVTLMNNTDRNISLNSDHPISIEYGNGFLTVKVNTDIKGEIQLKAKERLSFEIDAYNAEQVFASLPFDSSNHDKQLFGLLNITSEHYSFNRTVPVTSMNALVT